MTIDLDKLKKEIDALLSYAQPDIIAKASIEYFKMKTAETSNMQSDNDINYVCVCECCSKHGWHFECNICTKQAATDGVKS